MTKRMKPEERKAELLKQARTLFIANGYEQVRVDDILNASGISKGGFYHHFDSKDDVLRLLVEDEATGIAEVAAGSKSTNAIQTLISIFEAGSVFLDGKAGISKTLSTFPAKALYLNALEASFIRHLKPAFINLLDRGIADGSFSQTDPHTAAELFMAVNNHANRKSVLEDWPELEAIAYAKASIQLLGQHLGISADLEELQNRITSTRKG